MRLSGGSQARDRPYLKKLVDNAQKTSEVDFWPPYMHAYTCSYTNMPHTTY